MPAPLNRLKLRLAAGETVYGCWVGMADPYAAEMAATCGFDWLLIDGEHAPNDLRSTMAQLAVVADAPMVLVTRTDSPYASLEALLDKARSAPGAVQYATFGPGSAPHLLGELFGVTADLKLMAVPYKGSAQTVIGVIGGEIDMAFDTLSSSLPHVRAGKLKALAVFSKERVPQLPDVPTVAEKGLAGSTFSGWYAVALPKGTPQPVREKLGKALQKALETEKVRATFSDSALLPVYLDEAGFRARTEQELTMFRDLARRADIQVE